MNALFLFLLAIATCTTIFAIENTTYDRKKVVDTLTREELLDILKVNGYATELIPEKDHLVRLVISGMRGTIILSKTSLQFFAVAKVEAQDGLQRVNKWNQQKRYSRSYVDKDGDPILELDLDMTGGVTIARVEDYLGTVTKSLLAWMMELSV